MIVQHTNIATAAALAAALCIPAQLAAAKDKVQVGFIGPLSGGTSSNGLGGRNAADLAVKLRNADADAAYEYELTVLDDECKPDKGVQVATKLAADRDIIAAATHYCSAVAIATVDVYAKFGLPVIVWGAVLPDITYGNDHKEVHRVNGTMINQNQVAAEFMTGQGYKTWAVIHDTTDYGKGHNTYFSQYLAENGGEILGTFGVTAEQQDFTAELTSIKALDPDVLYFGGLTPIGVRIRAQMEKIGVDAPCLRARPASSPTLSSKGSAILQKAWLPSAKERLSKSCRAVSSSWRLMRWRAMRSRRKLMAPSPLPAMNLILDTIEEVGPDRDAVRDALNQTQGHESIVGEVSFDDHGQNSVAAITKYVIQDGKWTLWEESEYADGTRKLKGL